MLQFVKSWLETREEGQGLVGYGLIIALVAVVCVAALKALGGGVSAVLGQINGSL